MPTPHVTRAPRAQAPAQTLKPAACALFAIHPRHYKFHSARPSYQPRRLVRRTSPCLVSVVERVFDWRAGLLNVIFVLRIQSRIRILRTPPGPRVSTLQTARPFPFPFPFRRAI